MNHYVSIPFSSGRRRRRWLQHRLWRGRILRFQSPSHRGGGAAKDLSSFHPKSSNCFNPLLIGEAAPPKRGDHSSDNAVQVSIPFSSGRRRRHIDCAACEHCKDPTFQSPSHRGGGAAPTFLSAVNAGAGESFNPLLIGEAAPPVRAAWRSAIRPPCFNPLLIGEAAPPQRRPMIAKPHRSSFQSPSHRGGGAAVQKGYPLGILF